MKIQLPDSPLTRENYFSFNEYQGKPVISSSALRHIYPGEGGSFKRLQMYLDGQMTETKPHYSTGQMIHKYLEDKDNFIVSPDVLPEPGVIKVVEYVFHNQPLAETLAKSFDNNSAAAWPLIGTAIISSARAIGYQPKWGDDAILRKVQGEGAGYWKFLCEAQGHFMLTSAQKVAFDGMSQSVLDNRWSELIFHKDALHEVPILFSVDVEGTKIWCKSLLDWILFGKDEMSTITVIDFKTTSKPLGSFFQSQRVDYRYQEGVLVPISSPVTGSYWNYRYYRQFYFYQKAVEALFTQVYPKWVKRLPPIDFEVLPMESVAPFECELTCLPTFSAEAGLNEFTGCMHEISKYYKTLKKF